MINQLDQALRSLLERLGAQAAVVWGVQSEPYTGAVVSTCPLGLLPSGTDWPTDTGIYEFAMERDPARLASLIPAPLRNALPVMPGAARSFRLGERDVYLLVVWEDAQANGDLTGDLRRLITEELGDLSHRVEEDHFIAGEVTRLRAVVNGLEDAVVSVDTVFRHASLNEAAAKLFRLSPGQVEAYEFATALTSLASRALNYAEVSATIKHLNLDPSAQSDTVWRFADEPTHLRVFSTPVTDGAFAGRVWVFYDDSKLHQALEASEHAHAVLRASSDAMLEPQAEIGAVRNGKGEIVDFTFLEVNRATCEYLQVQHDDLVGTTLLQSFPNVDGSGMLAHFVRCAESGEPAVLDDFYYFNELLDDARRYDIRAARISTELVSLTWRDVTDRYDAARRIAASEDRLRRLMVNSIIGMGLVSPQGRFEFANPALCEFLGYDVDTLHQKYWMEVTAPEYVAAEREKIDDIIAGRIDCYRMIKQYIHADGSLLWGNLSVSCIRDADGRVEHVMKQIVDVTTEAEQNASNLILASRLQAQTDRLMSELTTAAAYVASLLPGDLHGQVTVTSRYLPSGELAGDCYDYSWVGDDHLTVYLLDVSGHGIAPALVSISVQNMLRSAALPRETLLEPEKVLASLNHNFQMDRQGGNYFTIWYGVYQKSTRTLRYSSAGHPPALLFTSPSEEPIQLTNESMPVGMFDNSVFTANSVDVPEGSELLLYSDGAYEWALPGGQAWSVADFIALCSRHARSGNWSLGALVEELRARTPEGEFDDDCSLVLVNFG